MTDSTSDRPVQPLGVAFYVLWFVLSGVAVAALCLKIFMPAEKLLVVQTTAQGLVVQRAPLWYAAALLAGLAAFVGAMWCLFAFRQNRGGGVISGSAAAIATIVALTVAGAFIPSLFDRLELKPDSIECVEHGFVPAERTRSIGYDRLYLLQLGEDELRFVDAKQGGEGKFATPPGMLAAATPALLKNLSQAPAVFHAQAGDVIVMTRRDGDSVMETILCDRLLVKVDYQKSRRHETEAMNYCLLDPKAFETLRNQALFDWPARAELADADPLRRRVLRGDMVVIDSVHKLEDGPSPTWYQIIWDFPTLPLSTGELAEWKDRKLAEHVKERPQLKMLLIGEAAGE